MTARRDESCSSYMPTASVGRWGCSRWIPPSAILPQSSNRRFKHALACFGRHAGFEQFVLGRGDIRTRVSMIERNITSC